MTRIIVCFVILMFHFHMANAQRPSNLSGNEMDFWIGEWSLELISDDGKFGKAENSVTKILDDKVIKEDYRGLEGIWEGYEGQSFTVYDQRYGTFYQTWVANNGTYADYNFDMEDGKRIFGRETWVGPNKKIYVRMVFHSINENSFIWEWQSSDDEGETWKINSKVKYSRKGSF